jgi:predicted O-methyltransferase YrrM
MQSVRHDVRLYLYKFQRFAERSWNLYRLSSQKDPVTSSIALAIRTALKPTLTPEEKRWIDRIEQLRTELNTSTKPITRKDFGAGDPNSNRTPEEMAAGVEVTDTIGQFSRMASKSPFWDLVLFKLIRAVRPRSCIEMGSAVGISGSYQAAALHLNGQGTLITLEGASSIAEIAGNNFKQLGLNNVEVVVGRFETTLTDVLAKQRPVDYVFIDGHHDEHATVDYLEQILPFCSEKALLVFDDISWSEGMKRAWDVIAKDSRIDLAVTLGPVGLCVIDRAIDECKHFSILLQ